ncbi:phage tail fiber protein [Nocardia africana]
MALSTNTAKQAAADGVKSLAAAPWVSLHTANPGSTGASEATGAPYGRVQATWASGTTGTLTAAQVAVPAPAGTYTYGGLWTAQTGGTFIAGDALNPAVTLSANGTINVTPSYTQT